ncbi:MAG: hypothetical protein ACI9O4_001439 [Chitinophagales bacterium]|jgi:hypothetical protein
MKKLILLLLLYCNTVLLQSQIIPIESFMNVTVLKPQDTIAGLKMAFNMFSIPEMVFGNFDDGFEVAGKTGIINQQGDFLVDQTPDSTFWIGNFLIQPDLNGQRFVSFERKWMPSQTPQDSSDYNDLVIYDYFGNELTRVTGESLHANYSVEFDSHDVGIMENTDHKIVVGGLRIVPNDTTISYPGGFQFDSNAVDIYSVVMVIDADNGNIEYLYDCFENKNLFPANSGMQFPNSTSQNDFMHINAQWGYKDTLTGVEYVGWCDRNNLTKANILNTSTEDLILQLNDSTLTFANGVELPWAQHGLSFDMDNFNKDTILITFHDNGGVLRPTRIIQYVVSDLSSTKPLIAINWEFENPNYESSQIIGGVQLLKQWFPGRGLDDYMFVTWGGNIVSIYNSAFINTDPGLRAELYKWNKQSQLFEVVFQVHLNEYMYTDTTDQNGNPLGFGPFSSLIGDYPLLRVTIPDNGVIYTATQDLEHKTIKVFPNPAIDGLVAIENYEGLIKVVNTLGQVVESKMIARGNNIIRIAESGLFFLVGDGITEKIVIP